ncbi:protoporphyrinogen oxidase [Parachlamydia sp. AcF125]|uniref:protoporphyrinogen oxidase n=1 Tax=Parachlamydia sp. AcF125 TaxID=2795736 RepID=UPI001BC9F698|nr:protoporphyrinogen oxidase [Parachlamydia sp. AcF125]MBS4168191.1 Protoporphyrinogen oxidase [Parachlamydia sp. AcF125]
MVNENSSHIVILGAGISGLTLAWSLKRRFGNRIRMTILEKGNRTGGSIHTHHQDGFLFEYGPRSCRPSGTGLETLKLIEALKLEEEVIAESPLAKKRYLWKNQKLHPFPSSFFSFFTSPLTRTTIWPIVREFLKPKALSCDESISSFFSRRFSSEIAKTLLDPLVSGIYAGDIDQLSIRSCFPLLYQWEQTYGSVGKGLLFSPKKRKNLTDFQEKMQKTSLFSFQKGMETLPKVLSGYLNSELKLNHLVAALEFSQKKIKIHLHNQPMIEADYLFSTLPSYALAKLITHPELAKQLNSIPHTPIAVVNLGWHQPVLSHQGFGFLIPSSEKEQILGIVWDSSVFPSQNAHPSQTRLTVMIGGAHFCPHLFNTLDTSLFNSIAIKALKKYLNILQPPDTSVVKVIPQAIPQYLVGHHQKVETIQNIVSQMRSPFQIIGSSFFGVSLNDCIAQSVQIAESFQPSSLSICSF